MFQKAVREKALLRLALQGPSGSGKTYSALLIARGVVGPEGKIAVIDTEEGSASLYSDLTEFYTASLKPPFEPERYIEMIKAAEDAGCDIIVIDSGSHEWMGSGGILEIHDKMPGNSYTNWAKVNPRHEAFLNAILRSKCHVIVTLRSKQAYEIAEKNGKKTVEKLGLQSQMREGFEYELTAVLAMQNEMATRDKDRTRLFKLDHWFKPGVETGEMLREWLDGGIDPVENILGLIDTAPDSDTLTRLYRDNASMINVSTRKDEIVAAFTARKGELAEPSE